MCDAAYARHVPERLCSGTVLLEVLYQVFDLYLYLYSLLAQSTTDRVVTY